MENIQQLMGFNSGSSDPTQMDESDETQKLEQKLNEHKMKRQQKEMRNAGIKSGLNNKRPGLLNKFIGVK